MIKKPDVKLEYDDKTHSYFIDGRKVPSVTGIVGAVLPIKFVVDEWYLQRGKAVHEAVELLLAGCLDPATVDPEIMGYVEQAQAARVALGIVPKMTETFVCDPVRMYAGRFDALDVHHRLWDWKTGSVHAAAEIQLGGYAWLIETDLGIKVRECGAIRLNRTSWSIEKYDVRRARGLFMACLSIYGFLYQGRVGK